MTPTPTSGRLHALRVADQVINHHDKERQGTHSERCYLWHVECLAYEVRRALENDR